MPFRIGLSKIDHLPLKAQDEFAQERIKTVRIHFYYWNYNKYNFIGFHAVLILDLCMFYNKFYHTIFYTYLYEAIKKHATMNSVANAKGLRSPALKEH